MLRHLLGFARHVRRGIRRGLGYVRQTRRGPHLYKRNRNHDGGEPDAGSDGAFGFRRCRPGPGEAIAPRQIKAFAGEAAGAGFLVRAAAGSAFLRRP